VGSLLPGPAPCVAVPATTIHGSSAAIRRSPEKSASSPDTPETAALPASQNEIHKGLDPETRKDHSNDDSGPRRTPPDYGKRCSPSIRRRRRCRPPGAPPLATPRVASSRLPHAHPAPV